MALVRRNETVRVPLVGVGVARPPWPIQDQSSGGTGASETAGRETGVARRGPGVREAAPSVLRPSESRIREGSGRRRN